MRKRGREVWREHRDPGHVPVSGSGTCDQVLCMCGLDSTVLNTAKLGVVTALCSLVLDNLYSGSPGPGRGSGEKAVQYIACSEHPKAISVWRGCRA